jgi:WD40-like Beta Propeller Repeat
MKRSWTALAVMLVAVFLVAGCNDYGNTFQNNTGAFLQFISPQQISAGSPSFTLLMNGTGFVQQTQVYWNGSLLPTKVTLDSNQNVTSVTATVAASLVAKPGVAQVYTKNPASGAGNNGRSNTVFFTINPPPNPQPVLTSVAPSVTPASTAGQVLNLTLTGSNFITNSDLMQASQVTWSFGGMITNLTLTAANITATQIQTTVPANLFANTGSSSLVAAVTVVNPPAGPPAGCVTNCTGGGGGGPSNSLMVTICAAGQNTCAPAATAKDAAVATVAEETPAVSLDGRYVSYTALQNDRAQIFLRDTCEGAASSCQPSTTLLSVAPDGTAANEESHTPSMSADGRYVAFSSAATNLVANAPAGRQVYLRDTCVGAAASCKPSTVLVSTDSSGALVGAESILPSISSSGRFVAFLAVTPSASANKFTAQSKNLPTDSKNSGYRQVFIRDTCLGVSNCTAKTARISLLPGDGTESGANPAGPALSGDVSHLALTGGSTATLFTRSVAVDDRVFLAITNGKP